MPLAALALLVAPATGQACMSSGPDGFSTGLVWDHKPSDLPDGAYVIRIEEVRPIEGSWAFTALVIEGPSAMVGKRYRFVALNLNSCVGFGSSSGYAVVSREKGRIEVEGEERATLKLVDYAPTTMNEVVRALFGGSQWRYPGEPSEQWVFVP